MEVKKRGFNADFDKIPEAVERIFKNRRLDKNLKKFKSRQPKLFNLAIISAIVVILVMYFIFPSSSVRAVSVDGNQYLSEEYIKDLSGVDTSSKLYLTIPVLVQRKLCHDPIISQASVSIHRGNTVSIHVTENKLIGYQDDNGNSTIWFGTGDSAALSSSSQEVKASIPKLIGFTDTDLLKKVATALNDVDDSIIQQISSISVYPLRYDANGLLVHMRIGTYFIATYTNLSVLNEYFNIYSQATDKTKCLWGTSKDQVAYTADCPWTQSGSNTEYWYDDAGNVRTDANGSPIEKHFYVDQNGSYALDANGNKIAIPIDNNGIEVIDDSFQENYAAGYYATGILDLPTLTQ